MSGRFDGSGVVPVEVGRSEDELTRRQQRDVRASEVLAALGRDPRRARRDADVGCERPRAVAADHRAHGVGAVAGVVARLIAADAGGVPPVVIVVERAAAEVAAVLVHEGRMVELNSGVDVRHHDATADDAVRPDVIGADLLHAPLGLGREHRGLRLDGLHEGIDLLRPHDLDAGKLRDRGRQRSAAVDDEGVPQPEALGVRTRGCLDEGDRRGLRSCRLPEPVHHEASAPVEVVDLPGARKVGLGGELDDESVDSPERRSARRPRWIGAPSPRSAEDASGGAPGEAATGVVSRDRIVSRTKKRVAGRAAAPITDRDMAGTDLLGARMR